MSDETGLPLREDEAAIAASNIAMDLYDTYGMRTRNCSTPEASDKAWKRIKEDMALLIREQYAPFTAELDSLHEQIGRLAVEVTCALPHTPFDDPIPSTIRAVRTLASELESLRQDKRQLESDIERLHDAADERHLHDRSEIALLEQRANEQRETIRGLQLEVLQRAANQCRSIACGHCSCSLIDVQTGDACGVCAEVERRVVAQAEVERLRRAVKVHETSWNALQESNEPKSAEIDRLKAKNDRLSARLLYMCRAHQAVNCPECNTRWLGSAPRPAEQSGGEASSARCANCGSYDLRVANVIGGCCEADRHTEAWQKIGCMDCGQDLGVARDGSGRMILAHRELAQPEPARADIPDGVLWNKESELATARAKNLEKRLASRPVITPEGREKVATVVCDYRHHEGAHVIHRDKPCGSRRAADHIIALLTEQSKEVERG